MYIIVSKAIKCQTGALSEKRHSCAISTLQRDESLDELQWAPSYKRAAVPLAWHTSKPFAHRLRCFSVIRRRWSKTHKAGFGLFPTFCTFIQRGLKCDWGMERGVWDLKCSMVMALISSFYSPCPLPTLCLLLPWFELHVIQAFSGRSRWENTRSKMYGLIKNFLGWRKFWY